MVIKEFEQMKTPAAGCARGGSHSFNNLHGIISYADCSETSDIQEIANRNCGGVMLLCTLPGYVTQEIALYYRTAHCVGGV